MAPTYRISLWDHDPPLRPGESEAQYHREGEFSLSLAAAHLGGPSTGLSLFGLAQALRKLKPHWSPEVMLVEREETCG